MAKTGIRFYYENGSPDSITSISCGNSERDLKGTVRLTPFNNLTAFNGGDNGLESVIGFSQLTNLKNFEIIGSNTVGFDVAELPGGLEYLDIRGSNTTTGNLSSLPSSLLNFRNWGNNTITGNITVLKLQTPNLELYSHTGPNTVTGNISALPPNLYWLSNTGPNTISGDISSLQVETTGLQLFNLYGSNTVTGNIETLPSTVYQFAAGGLNTTFGNISGLPSGLTTYTNLGQNSTTGNIGNLPSGLTRYQNIGNNTTTGDLSGLPSGLRFYQNWGLNTTFGNLNTMSVSALEYYFNTASSSLYGPLSALFRFSNLINFTHGGTGNLNNLVGDVRELSAAPKLKTFDVFNGLGQNNISGSINNLPEGLTLFRHFTSGIVTGNIESLPRSLTYYGLGGGAANVTTGHLSGLPPNLQFFITTGPVNTITGNINSLPRTLVDYRNYGLNTTTGNYINLPRIMTIYDNRGNNTVGGNLADLPVELQTFQQYGRGVVVGNVGDLPTKKLTFLDISSASIESSAAAIVGGDIGTLPNVTPTLRSLRIQTGNTLTGNIAGIAGWQSIRSLNIRGNNTVFGDISIINSLPNINTVIIESPFTNLTGDLSSIKDSAMNNWLEITGTITGDIANLPTQLQVFSANNFGNSSIYGSLSTLPPNIYLYSNRDTKSRAFLYYDGTGGNGYGKKLWRNEMNNITLSPSGADVIPVTHLVTLLVDLTAYTWVSRNVVIGPTISIGSSNNPVINVTTYPEASTAIATLQGKGVTVTVNTTT
jgi:hypothetical protein